MSVKFKLLPCGSGSVDDAAGTVAFAVTVVLSLFLKRIFGLTDDQIVFVFKSNAVQMLHERGVKRVGDVQYKKGDCLGNAGKKRG